MWFADMHKAANAIGACTSELSTKRSGEAVVIAKENLSDLKNLLDCDSGRAHDPHFQSQVMALRGDVSDISDLLDPSFFVGIEELMDACGLAN